jgi:hypothetical protein
MKPTHHANNSWREISGVARYSSSFELIKDESGGTSERGFSDSETVNEGPSGMK